MRKRILAVISTLVMAAGSATADVDLSTLRVNPNPRLGLAFPGSDTKYYPLMAQARDWRGARLGLVGSDRAARRPV